MKAKNLQGTEECENDIRINESVKFNFDDEFRRFNPSPIGYVIPNQYCYCGRLRSMYTNKFNNFSLNSDDSVCKMNKLPNDVLELNNSAVYVTKKSLMLNQLLEFTDTNVAKAKDNRNRFHPPTTIPANNCQFEDDSSTMVKGRQNQSSRSVCLSSSIFSDKRLVSLFRSVALYWFFCLNTVLAKSDVLKRKTFAFDYDDNALTSFNSNELKLKISPIVSNCFEDIDNDFLWHVILDALYDNENLENHSTLQFVDYSKNKMNLVLVKRFFSSFLQCLIQLWPNSQNTNVLTEFTHTTNTVDEFEMQQSSVIVYRNEIEIQQSSSIVYRPISRTFSNSLFCRNILFNWIQSIVLCYQSNFQFYYQIDFFENERFQHLTVFENGPIRIAGGRPYIRSVVETLFNYENNDSSSEEEEQVEVEEDDNNSLRSLPSSESSNSSYTLDSGADLETLSDEEHLIDESSSEYESNDEHSGEFEDDIDYESEFVEDYEYGEETESESEDGFEGKSEESYELENESESESEDAFERKSEESYELERESESESESEDAFERKSEESYELGNESESESEDAFERKSEESYELEKEFESESEDAFEEKSKGSYELEKESAFSIITDSQMRSCLPKGLLEDNPMHGPFYNIWRSPLLMEHLHNHNRSVDQTPVQERERSTNPISHPQYALFGPSVSQNFNPAEYFRETENFSVFSVPYHPKSNQNYQSQVTSNVQSMKDYNMWTSPSFIECLPGFGKRKSSGVNETHSIFDNAPSTSSVGAEHIQFNDMPSTSYSDQFASLNPVNNAISLNDRGAFKYYDRSFFDSRTAEVTFTRPASVQQDENDFFSSDDETDEEVSEVNEEKEDEFESSGINRDHFFKPIQPAFKVVTDTPAVIARSASGSMYVQNKKYMTFKHELDPIFPIKFQPKFEVRTSEKACQTEDSMFNFNNFDFLLDDDVNTYFQTTTIQRTIQTTTIQETTQVTVNSLENSPGYFRTLEDVFNYIGNSDIGGLDTDSTISTFANVAPEHIDPGFTAGYWNTVTTSFGFLY